MNLKDIESQWEVDSKIDDMKLDTESLSIPKLYNKYMRIQNSISYEISVLDAALDKMKVDKLKYYRGWVDRPYPKKIVNAPDLKTFIEGDADYLKLNSKLAEANLRHKTLDRILKQIENRSFYINTAIDYRKFIEGGR